MAMVTGSYPPQPCGIGDYTDRLVRELLAAGINVEVITTRAKAPRSNASVRYEAESWRMSSWKKGVAWMREQGYDLVHIQYPARFYGYPPDLALLSYLLRKGLPGVPLVVTFHEFRITHLLRQLTVGAIALPVHKVLFTADIEREAFVRVMPWLRRKTDVIRMAASIATLPFPPDARTELRASLDIEEGDVVIVYFGFLHPNKGIETLLKTFSLVHKARSNTRLLMLSLLEPDTNHYHAQILQEAQRLDITGAIVWVGYLSASDVSRHLSSADIGFFPYQDGVTLRRLSFITAMCHGLPCVTTAGPAGGAGIGLSDRGNVMLVSPSDNIDGFAGRLSSLVDSADSRRAIGDSALRWGEQFQWGSVVERMTGVYQSLMSKRKGSEGMNS